MQLTIPTQNYKFKIEQDSEKRVQVTAFDSLTSEVFQSEWTRLQQISAATIAAALKQENPHIHYHIDRTANAITLSINAEFSFLPKIEEFVQLPLMEKLESQNKFQLAELSEEFAKLQQKFSMVLNQKLDLLQVKQSFPLERSIPAGFSIIQLSGYVLSNAEDVNYDLMAKAATVLLEIQEEGPDGKPSIVEKANFMLFSSLYEGYEFPIKLTHLARLKRKGKITFRIQQGIYVLSGCILTVMSL